MSTIQVGYSSTDLSGAYWPLEVVQTSSATGTQNNFTINTTTQFCAASGAAPVFTGLTGGRTGRSLVIHNVGSGTLTFNHQDSNSTAANRIITPSSAAFTIAAGQTALLFYDGASSRWRVREQVVGKLQAADSTIALSVDSTSFIDSATQPRCVAFNSGTQTLSTSTPAVITLDSEDLDVGGLHSLVTNTERLTIPTGGDGFYRVIAQTSYTQASAGSDGRITISVRKNGTAVRTANGFVPYASEIYPIIIMWEGNLAAADYIEMYGDPGGRQFSVGSATKALSSMLSVVKLW